MAKKIDAVQYAHWCETNWKNNLGEMTGYTPFTTFFSDFSIAEFVNGTDGVKATFEKTIAEWSYDYKYFTELVMVVNHKAWEMSARMYKEDIFSKQTLEKLGKLYTELYYKADELFYQKWGEDEDANKYYYEVTD